MSDKEDREKWRNTVRHRTQYRQLMKLQENVNDLRKEVYQLSGMISLIVKGLSE